MIFYESSIIQFYKKIRFFPHRTLRIGIARWKCYDIRILSGLVSISPSVSKTIYTVFIYGRFSCSPDPARDYFPPLVYHVFHWGLIMKNKYCVDLSLFAGKPLSSLLIPIFICLLLPTFLNAADTGKKLSTPNILWIIAEDMGPELGCYGHPEVVTPNLDRLAGEGVMYTRAYTSAPVCSPSRSAFMTGMYQTSIGAHNHRSHREDGYQLPKGVRVITDILREGGYFTGNLVDLTGDPEERFLRGTGKTDWNFSYPGNREPFDTSEWDELRVNQPFYAQINFPESHRGASWDEAHKRIDKQADPAKVSIPPYYPDDPLTRKVWAQYLNAIMAFDLKVGMVMEKLEEEGLLENTVVIVFGDNGRAMVRAKQWPYESGLHVPLLIRWPGNYPPPCGFEPGTIDSRLISIIDVSATTLDIAEIEPPLLMQGRVFLGGKSSPPRKYVFGGRDRGDETVDRIRTVRDSRFRYIRNYYPERPFLQLNRYKEWTYPILMRMREMHLQGQLNALQEFLFNPTRPEEELYDLDKDPFETRNLARNSEYDKIKQRLTGALDTWIMETNDQGRIPEPREVIDYWESVLEKNYGNREKTRVVY